MQTSECPVIKELPDPINLADEQARKRLDQLGQQIASQEHLHYEGYIAFTGEPYSVDKAKTTLCFD